MPMRTAIAALACALAAGACGPDEFIPAATDGAAIDGAGDARPTDAPPAPTDGATSDAGAPADAMAIDATAIDAAPPTYTHDVDIQPIWTAGCASASCHPFMTAAYDNIVDVPSSQLPTMPFIKPGDPDRSYLLHKLLGTHLGVGGNGAAMPPGGPLKAATLDMLRVWILEGAPR